MASSVTQSRQEGRGGAPRPDWWRQTLAILWQVSPRQSAILAAIVVFTALVPVGQLTLSSRLIDAMVEAVAASRTVLLQREILTPLLGLIALYLVTDLLRVVRGDQQILFGERLSFETRRRLAAKGLELDLAHFDDAHWFDRHSRAAQEASFRPMALLSSLLEAGGAAITGVSFVLALLHFEPALVILLAVLSLPNTWLELVYQQRLYDLRRRQTRGRRREEYLWNLLGLRQSAKELRVFDLGGHLLERVRGAFSRRHRQDVDFTRRKIARLALARLAYLGGFAVGYALLIRAVLGGGLSVGGFVLYTGAMAGLQGALRSTGQQLANLRAHRLFLEDYFLLMETPPFLPRRPEGLPLPRRLETGFELRGVTFAYPSCPRPVLRGVDLRLHPGETVALVGENGSGKTTLAKLLNRLYAPSSGQILLENRDLADYRLRDIQTGAGVVYQDFLRYQLTARENIGFGDLRRLDDLPALEDAAERSGLGELVAGWPEGLETLLSPEMGGSLWPSEGQWQRFAMARALLHDAPILILDEPTASLDPKIEHQIFERFRDLAAGRLVVLISHRLSMTRLADRIVVLRDGVIAEEGTHAQLMAAGGPYASMYRMQAEKYEAPTRVTADLSTPRAHSTDLPGGFPS